MRSGQRGEVRARIRVERVGDRVGPAPRQLRVEAVAGVQAGALDEPCGRLLARVPEQEDTADANVLLVADPAAERRCLPRVRQFLVRHAPVILTSFRHEPAGYECPFCIVVRGEENPPWTYPADVVWRDEATTAWINRRWWANNPGAVVLVPNRHVENMYELDRDLAGLIHEAARAIALAMKDAYGCDGISTRQHNEPGGNQEVWHYHLHVFPRWHGDDLYGSPHLLTTPAERAPYAERLRRSLRSWPRRSAT